MDDPPPNDGPSQPRPGGRRRGRPRLVTAEGDPTAVSILYIRNFRRW